MSAGTSTVVDLPLTEIVYAIEVFIGQEVGTEGQVTGCLSRGLVGLGWLVGLVGQEGRGVNGTAAVMAGTSERWFQVPSDFMHAACTPGSRD